MGNYRFLLPREPLVPRIQWRPIYWTMWKLPMFGCNDPAQVLLEVECKKAYPNYFVRIIGFDNKRKCSALVSLPTSHQAAKGNFKQSKEPIGLVWGLYGLSFRCSLGAILLLSVYCFPFCFVLGFGCSFLLLQSPSETRIWALRRYVCYGNLFVNF